MATAVPSAADQPLFEVASATFSTTAEVFLRLQAIDGLLAANDGLKWFNRLYGMVTQAINLHPPGGAWQNPTWLNHLDVVFAGFYFNAIRDFLTGQPIPSAWTVLFEARFRSGIDRIQFALAGMNAHINHDLALALLATDAELNIVPSLDSPEHRDFESVNGVLKSLLPSALNGIATDTLGVLAQDTGKIGRLLAFWDICAARELAWDFANHLRGLAGPIRNAAIDAQDSLTGAIGRAILVMT